MSTGVPSAVLITLNSGLKKKNLTTLRKLYPETTPAIQCPEGDTGACILCGAQPVGCATPGSLFIHCPLSSAWEFSFISKPLFPLFFLQQFRKKNKPSQAERLARLTLGTPVKWIFSVVPSASFCLVTLGGSSSCSSSFEGMTVLSTRTESVSQLKALFLLDECVFLTEQKQ